MSADRRITREQDMFPVTKPRRLQMQAVTDVERRKSKCRLRKGKRERRSSCPIAGECYRREELLSGHVFVRGAGLTLAGVVDPYTRVEPFRDLGSKRD